MSSPQPPTESLNEKLLEALRPGKSALSARSFCLSRWQFRPEKTFVEKLASQADLAQNVRTRGPRRRRLIPNQAAGGV